MKIKMRTILAGPGGVAQPGQIIDRPEEEAKQLVERGYAVYVTPPRPKVGEESITKEPEAAVVEQAEAAVMPRAKGRKGGFRG